MTFALRRLIKYSYLLTYLIATVLLFTATYDSMWRVVIVGDCVLLRWKRRLLICAGMLEPMQPEHVAPLILWLCHEHCSITGQLFECGGGWMSRCKHHIVKLFHKYDKSTVCVWGYGLPTVCISTNFLSLLVSTNHGCSYSIPLVMFVTGWQPLLVCVSHRNWSKCSLVGFYVLQLCWST